MSYVCMSQFSFMRGRGGGKGDSIKAGMSALPPFTETNLNPW